MIQKNITEIRNDKIFNSKWVVIVIIGFILGLISLNLPIDHEYGIYLVFGAGLVIVYGLLLSQERTYIKIEGNDFIIERSLFNNKKTKRFNIKKIENIKYRLNVKSNTYTSAGHVRVLGIDTTPESWKKYYYHKEILSFNYDGKIVEIGKWKKPFGAKDWVAKISDIKDYK